MPLMMPPIDCWIPASGDPKDNPFFDPVEHKKYMRMMRRYDLIQSVGLCIAFAGFLALLFILGLSYAYHP